jgi:PAT family beta-lactamase induction signal transducer AmpG
MIGFFAWAGFAYSFKFLWAPIVDRLPLPVLDRLLGRRRAWLVLAQALLFLALLMMAMGDPSENLYWIAVASVLIAFFSATQDIALDAWRIDVATDDQQALMASIYQIGYRIGMLAAGAGALYIAGFFSYNLAYLTMAALILIGPLGVLLAPRTADPEGLGGGVEEVRRKTGEAAAWLYAAVIAPFVDFIQRYMWAAIFILALIGLYRLTDFVMGFMANPFYLEMGYTEIDIANVSKIYGVLMTMAGAFIAGLASVRFGIYPVLLVGAIVGAGSNLTFAWLSTLNDPGIGALTAVITVENFSGGWAGTALIAYMSSLTNRAFSATQYALFSSFYALPGKFFGGFSGMLVDGVGWTEFYLISASLGIPAVCLVLIAMNWRSVRRMAKHDAARA